MYGSSKDTIDVRENTYQSIWRGGWPRFCSKRTASSPSGLYPEQLCLPPSTKRGSGEWGRPWWERDSSLLTRWSSWRILSCTRSLFHPVSLLIGALWWVSLPLCLRARLLQSSANYRIPRRKTRVVFIGIQYQYTCTCTMSVTGFLNAQLQKRHQIEYITLNLFSWSKNSPA